MTTKHYHYHSPHNGRVSHNHSGGTKKHVHADKGYMGYSKTETKPKRGRSG